MKVLIINGPNLNMLGKREPEIYGTLSYEELARFITDWGKSLSMEVELFQSNSEGAMIDKIHESLHFDGVIINAGAYTHTSIAVRDALLSVSLPAIEVHLSNIYAREEFRGKSYLSGVVRGVISGFGKESYYLAMVAMKAMLEGSAHE